MTSKTLWVVNYNDVNEFLEKAIEVGATAVAIRTDNDLTKAIGVFRAKNIAVFGWRWPFARRDPAMNEANKVIALFNKGLNGYYIDPEGAPDQPSDWFSRVCRISRPPFARRSRHRPAGEDSLSA